MKNGTKRHVFMPVLLVVAVVFGMTGCGKKFDASRYVKGCLDASTKGVFEDYVAMTNSTEEQAKKEYGERIEAEINSMTGTIDMSEEMKEKYRTVYKELYSKFKYEVGEATEGDNKSFAVPVKAYRLNVFAPTMEETQKQLEEKVKEMSKKKAPSTQESLQLYVEILADVLTEKLQNPEYGEPETIMINITLNSGSKEYQMSDSDVNKVFDALSDLNSVQ